MAVTVYTLPACVQCDSTKRMLKSIDVDYEEVDMSQDPVALEMVKTLGYRLDIFAPNPQNPSMTGALDAYIKEANKK